MPLAKPPFPRLQKDHRLARGLIAAWPFYEPYGTTVGGVIVSANDVSGNGLTAIGGGSGGTNNPTATNGRAGPAFNFASASSQYFTINSRPILNTGSQLTVVAWLNAAAAASTALISKYDIGLTARGWNIASLAGGQMAATLSADGGIVNAKSYQSSVVTMDSTWHMFGFTFNSGVLKLYNDGVLDGSPTKAIDGTVNSIYFNAGVNLAIGGQFNSVIISALWNGKIDAPMIFNRALTSDEMAQLYQDPFIMFRRRRLYKHQSVVAPAMRNLALIGAGM